MSKKKSLTTMTLKDFHGGSIPSELPLPSAPGLSPRPPDRAAAVARVDHHRSRPAAAAAAAAAAPAAFLTQPSRIGRHFDEDERTPFEASSAAVAPRRPAPPSQSPSPSPSPAARSDPRPTFPASGSGNAWGARREVGPAPRPSPPAPVASSQIWSASRIAQASAVEKVISGRWHSKPSTPPPSDSSPVIGFQELDVSDRRPSEMERPRSVGYAGLSAGPGRDSPVFAEAGEKVAPPPARPASHEGRVGDATDRPKLKLLPRSKPLDAAPEACVVLVEEKQVHQPVNTVQVEDAHEAHGNLSMAKTGVAAADGENRAAERPRLNLKPRSNAVGPGDGNAGKERQTVFGGARPRELVLKERGIDVVASDLEKTSPVSRAKNDFAKTESKLESVSINSSGEKIESFPAGQRSMRNVDRRDYRRDVDKVDTQRPSWREDNRRIPRDVEKPHEQPRPEPETWRKSVEQPKADVAGPRFGKGATALELAQAFSKSVSDTAQQSRLTSVTNQRAGPRGQDQGPFSRLTDNRAVHSQRKINGY